MRLTSLLLLVTVAVAPVVAQQTTPEICGRFVEKDGFRTLYLWGTPEQRGFAQGYLLADTILRSFEADLQKLMRGSRMKQYEKRLLKSIVPRFAFSADEEAELAGMLKGIKAKLPADKCKLAGVDRPVSLLDLKALNTVGDWMALGCSTFAISGAYTTDGKPAAARNFDFAGFRMVLDDQHVVVVNPSDSTRRGYAGVSIPGCIGVITALNAEGVFISIHDVFIWAPWAAIRKNVPRLCALRRIMMDVPAEGALEKSRELVQTWPTLYGNNVMIVTPKSGDGPFAGVLEYDNHRARDQGAALRVLDHPGSEKELYLLCTNHHRNRKPKRDDPKRLCKRYNGLKGAVAAREKKALSVPEMFETLSVAAFPRNGKPQERYHHGTTHQVVAFTGKRELHVRLGSVGKHITEITPVRVSVDEALAAAQPAKATAAPGGGDGGNGRN
ncbi:MAG: hypothetical protein CMJ83_07945 [Planctomycetes bacterium]|nr:hypothetical protein [Planctomycetota bacterium]